MITKEGTSHARKKWKATRITQMRPMSEDYIEHIVEQVDEKKKEALIYVDEQTHEAIKKVQQDQQCTLDRLEQLWQLLEANKGVTTQATTTE